MKDIKNFLTEASAKDGFGIKWTSSYQYRWKPNAEWLSINVNESHYDWIDKEEIAGWVEDGMDQEDVDAMYAMKPGDVYTPDGWNYYFRFKK